jgi:hypothetical protein
VFFRRHVFAEWIHFRTKLKLEWFVVPSKMVKSCHRPRGRTSKTRFADREEITKMIWQNAGKMWKGRDFLDKARVNQDLSRFNLSGNWGEIDPIISCNRWSLNLAPRPFGMSSTTVWHGSLKKVHGPLNPYDRLAQILRKKFTILPMLTTV